MNKTKIEWCLNPDGTPGYTWNPITGCLNGCPYCYARKLANARLKERYLANRELAEGGGKYSWEDKMFNPFYPRFWEDRLGLPIEHPTPMRPAKRKGIFVCDMSDLFGIGIPPGWTEQVMTTIKLCPYHRFYLLTKQPQNLAKFSPFPDNCRVGVTVTMDSDFDNALCALLNIQAKKRYFSFEPLLERIEVTPMLLVGIDWVIIGAQTKPYKPPKIEWVQEIVEACDKAGIPVFLKNNLIPMLNEYNKKQFPHSPCLWDMNGLIRQELPKIKEYC